MIPADEYSAKRNETPAPVMKPTSEEIPDMTGSGIKKEGDDIKLMRLYDRMVKAKGSKQLKEEKQMADLQLRLKPILGSYVSDSKALLKGIPKARIPQAEFILSVLTRLPKVSLNEKHLLIDGEAVSDHVDVVLKDILANEIFGVRSLIQRLRTKDEDDSSAFESFTNNMSEFLEGSRRAGPKTSTPWKSNRKSRISGAINELRQGASAQSASSSDTKAASSSIAEERPGPVSPSKTLKDLSLRERSHMCLRENARGRSKSRVPRSKLRAQRGNGQGTVQWEAY